MVVLLLMAAGAVAGTLGAMLGIGGGVLLVPILVLGFGVPLSHAIPASLVCVVAGSCAASASYMERRLSDVRLALLLELATVTGAIVGGVLAARLSEPMVALGFGAFALYVSVQMLLGASPEPATEAAYTPQNYPLGVGGSFVAGGLSAVLGVGGGPVKVPLMSYGMKIPFKVASATSNLMVGVTAAASVAIYSQQGQLRLALAAPLVVGVLIGAVIGSRWMLKVSTPTLKKLFAAVLLFIAGQMAWKGGVGLWPS